MPGLQDAISALREAVQDFLAEEAVSPAGVLSAVFAVNEEIGPALRSTGDPALKDLQLKVNEVTLAAKRGDRKRLKASMSAVLMAVASVDRPK